MCCSPNPHSSPQGLSFLPHYRLYGRVVVVASRENVARFRRKLRRCVTIRPRGVARFCYLIVGKNIFYDRTALLTHYVISAEINKNVSGFSASGRKKAKEKIQFCLLQVWDFPQSPISDLTNQGGRHISSSFIRWTGVPSLLLQQLVVLQLLLLFIVVCTTIHSTFSSVVLVKM